MASSSSRPRFWSVVTALLIALCVVVALPDSLKSWAPSAFKPSLHLGLDLAGGTQLDFRISEDEINSRAQEIVSAIDVAKAEGKNTEVQRLQFELQSTQSQHENLVEAIRTVLERRINSLGVSEATITPSYFGDEKHLLVECPGVIDVQRCIQTVGKTIQLEFKEQEDGDNGQYERRIRAQADSVYRSVTTGTGNLQVIGQDLSSQLGVTYFDSRPIFVSQLPQGMEGIANRKPTDPVSRNEAVIQTTAVDAQGQTVLHEIKGIYLTKVLEGKTPVPRPLTDPKEAYGEVAKTIDGGSVETKSNVKISSVPADLQSAVAAAEIGSEAPVTIDGKTAILYVSGRTDGTESMEASHILVQYAGAERADASVTRTKEEALAKIRDIQKRLKAGADFKSVARAESDGPSKDQDGSLGVLTRGLMVQPFEDAAFALKKGELSDIVETTFGYHIIRADRAGVTTDAEVSYVLLRASALDEAAATALIEKVQKGEVTRSEDQLTIRAIFFSLEPTGWKDTDLDGRHFRSAAVTTDQYTNAPVVQILFDDKGGEIFRELTKRNIGKQIAIFVGGELVSAPNVQAEISGGSAIITGSRTFEEAQKLATDLNTGAIPAPIYLAGQTTVEATLGADALERSVYAAGVGILLLCLFMIAIYRLLGLIASAALLLYVAILVAATKLPLFLVSDQHVVLTLAGIAGIILSVGMAVDANVLIFERMKEELRKGKAFRTALETGFLRAWPSIRDGNVSTLITCAILFVIGTSIIRGFAVTLTIGILISMFTAVVISRWLCRRLANSPLAERHELFGIGSGKPDMQ